METLMIKSKTSFQHILQSLNSSSSAPAAATTEPQQQQQQEISSRGEGGELRGADSRRWGGDAVTAPPPPGGRTAANAAMNQTTIKPLDAYAENTTGEYFPNYWTNSDELAAWNGSYLNATANVTYGYNISDFELLNVTNITGGVQHGFWFCAKWVDAQQDLFQAANLCFAVAFLIPKSFKQSILIVRALAAAGFLLLAAWAGTELCAPDVLAWNIVLVVVNSIHTILLIVRFLPPALSLELTELYLRLFKPFKVSKKHFKELAREARLLKLEPGEPYAVEGITPADERLSILLKGKLKVSCEQTHLHMIQPHQFVDSPEWEANHEQSDDVFQVTVVAEEGSTCLCWPRMRLERVLRHRPMLKIVLDSIIGKDITHKLYSLNETLTLSGTEVMEGREPRAILRSLSADAVDMGPKGKIRSSGMRTREKRFINADKSSPARNNNQQQWRPVASQFLPQSPFLGRAHPSVTRLASLTTQASSSSLQFPLATTPLLSPPPKRAAFKKTTSFRKNREVKFAVDEDAIL